MRKRRWPSATSAPSVKSRFSTIPFTRARTSATLKAEVRPGSSFVSVIALGVTVITPTSTGLAAGGGALAEQPATANAAAASAARAPGRNDGAVRATTVALGCAFMRAFLGASAPGAGYPAGGRLLTGQAVDRQDW